MKRRLAAFALIAAIASPSIANDRSVSVWQTSADGKQRLERLPNIPVTKGIAVGSVIQIYPSQKFQRIEGFGASITDSSAWLIKNKLPPSKQQALLRELFDPKTGLGLGLTRLTIGASDFSLAHYSYNDMPPGKTDPKLSHFSMINSAAMLATVKTARKFNPRLLVFAAPWSAPGWMKTSDSLIKGKVKTEFYPAYANYLKKYVLSMSASGVPIYAISVQNEPHFEPENYPGMHMQANERADFVGGHLGPAFAKNNVKTRILEWDHNWDQPDSPLAFFARADAAKYTAGTAWHCYAGDVSAQSRIHDAHPDKETWFTECSGGGWAPDFGATLGWMTKNLIIGATRNWAKGVILWNLALDEKTGPHLGGCGNCRGVVTIDQATGAVTRNVEYYVLGHASKFVRPGARRVASDTNIDGIETVAFENPGGGTLVLIALNGAAQARIFSVGSGEDRYSVNLPAGAIATLTWPTKKTKGMVK